jgi:hypothetical protein
MNAKRLFFMLILFALLLTAGGTALAGEWTVKAVAPLQGEGQVFEVAPGKLLIQATFTGIIYCEDAQGDLDKTLILCPAVLTLDKKTKRIEGNGYCTITNDQGDIIYAEWKNAGVLGETEGEFIITGGTGIFKGISGGGKMEFRAALVDTIVGLKNGATVRAATGLVIWPALKYTIPGR